MTFDELAAVVGADVDVRWDNNGLSILHAIHRAGHQGVGGSREGLVAWLGKTKATTPVLQALPPARCVALAGVGEVWVTFIAWIIITTVNVAHVPLKLRQSPGPRLNHSSSRGVRDPRRESDVSEEAKDIVFHSFNTSLTFLCQPPPPAGPPLDETFKVRPSEACQPLVRVHLEGGPALPLGPHPLSRGVASVLSQVHRFEPLLSVTQPTSPRYVEYR